MMAIELFHQASLIIDDAQDDADRRKGIPALWTQCGGVTATLFAHQLVFDGLSYVSETLGAEAVGLVTSATKQMIKGQSLDAAAEFGRTSEEYTAIAKLKTGVLYQLAGRLAFMAIGQSRSHTSELVAQLLLSAGVSHQAMDDINDASSIQANRQVFNAVSSIWRNIRQSILSVGSTPGETESIESFLARAFPPAKQLADSYARLMHDELTATGAILSAELASDRIHWWTDVVSALILKISKEENAL